MKTWMAISPVALALTACVTINIYFPAAAAEKAADKIIDEVWQIKDKAAPESKPPESKPAETKPAEEKPAAPASK